MRGLRDQSEVKVTERTTMKERSREVGEYYKDGSELFQWEKLRLVSTTIIPEGVMVLEWSHKAREIHMLRAEPFDMGESG
jgi:hypothetical protein